MKQEQIKYANVIASFQNLHPHKIIKNFIFYRENLMQTFKNKEAKNL